MADWQDEHQAGGLPLLRQRSSPAGLALLLALAGVHIVFTWGHLGSLWGDAGSWLHEVDRSAHGEVPYRDFYWPYPPVSIWLLGGLGTVFGSGVAPIWTMMSVVFLSIWLVYDRYVHLLVAKPVALPALLGAFLLACGYAHVVSPPLPTGMYTPAAPLGLLLLLLAAICTLRLLEGFRPGHAIGTGIFCGLCILTKQDFWIPAVYLVAVGSALLFLHRQARMQRLALLVWSTFLLTVFAGAAVVYAQAGGHALLSVLGGGGQVAEIRGRTFPSGQRLTSEMITLASLGFLSVILLLAGRTVSWKAARKWVAIFGLAAILGCSLHLFMSYHEGLRLLSGAPARLPVESAPYLQRPVDTKAHLLVLCLVWLKSNLLLHALPFLLPVSVLLLVAFRRWRSEGSSIESPVLFLLGLCVATRVRRGFEFVDWYQCLLEIPVYVAVVLLYIPKETEKTPRALSLGLALLLAFGGYSYWYWGMGSLTRRSEFERVDTPRGRVWVSTGGRAEFLVLQKLLDQADTGGGRPLFVFGYMGGYDYFLDRKNPTPLTQGFGLSNFDPARAVQAVLTHNPSALVLDTTRFDEMRGASPNFRPFSWNIETVLNVYARFDRPYFLQILARCREVAKLRLSPGQLYTLHDCSKPPE